MTSRSTLEHKQQPRGRFNKKGRPRPLPIRRSRKMSSNEPLSAKQSQYAVAHVNRALPTFGYRYVTTVRYVEHVNLGVQNNATQGYIFAANGLYDPNITGTGHQPKGFDQLMAFFNHYQVMASTITVNLYNDINQTLGGLSFAIAVQRSTSVLGWTSMLESGNNVHLMYPSIIEGGGPVPPFVRHGVNIASFQSIPDIMNDDTTKGTASANPATLVYYVLYTVCQDFGGTPTTGAVTADVIIDYRAVFTEPLQIGQS